MDRFNVRFRVVSAPTSIVNSSPRLCSIGTGHGVGLASHEDLTIAEDEPTELEPGMVFSIEPGVYFEDEWGVRIEDLVVVTEDDSERLNDSPRTWRPL